jgi:hypothetical protein
MRGPEPRLTAEVLLQSAGHVNDTLSGQKCLTFSQRSLRAHALPVTRRLPGHCQNFAAGVSWQAHTATRGMQLDPISTEHKSRSYPQSRPNGPTQVP